MKNNNDNILHFIINGEKHESSDQYITGIKIRKIGNIPNEEEIFLQIKEPWKDEPVADDASVDLARPGLEHFFSKKRNKIYKFSIDGKPQETLEQFIAGVEIRKRGNIPADYLIFLKVKGPGDDLLIEDKDRVDLSQPGKEEFYSCKPNTNNG